MAQAIQLLMKYENNINEFIDHGCFQIDAKNSGLIKKEKIQIKLQEIENHVKQLELYISMKNEVDKEIFDESFVEPWEKFYIVISKIAKSTKFLNVVANPIYKDYYKWFTTKQTAMKYTDCEFAIEFTELEDCGQYYVDFYSRLSELFLIIKDVSGYDKGIEIQSDKVMTFLESKLPKTDAADYMKVKAQWKDMFSRVYKYKLQHALSEGGEFPSIINFMNRPDVIMQVCNKYAKTQQEKDDMIAGQIRLMQRILDVDQIQDNKDVQEFKDLVKQLKGEKKQE